MDSYDGPVVTDFLINPHSGELTLLTETAHFTRMDKYPTGKCFADHEVAKDIALTVIGTDIVSAMDFVNDYSL